MSGFTTKRPFQISLDGTDYLVAEDAAQHGVPAAGRYTRSSVNPQRPQQATGTEAGEGSLAVTGLWRRSQFDFTGGAGQDYYDLASSVPNRYRFSVGVNPWTLGRLCQHLEMSSRSTVASISYATTGVFSKLFFLNGRIVWVLDNKFRYSATTNLITPTWTANTFTGSIKDAQTDGDAVYYVYAAGGGGRTSETGSWAVTDFGGATAGGLGKWDFISPCGGRVWVGGNSADATYKGKLVYLDAAWAATTMYTHPALGSFQWGGVVSSPKGFYAWGTLNPTQMAVNARGEIYWIGIDATGVPTTPQLVATFPAEGIYTMVVSGNVAFIGTTRGFRVAELDGASFTYGPLVQFAGVDRAVRCAVSDGRFVVFPWGDMTANGNDTTTWGVGRVDLSYMTRPLVPAFAPAECLAVGTGAKSSAMTGPAGLCLVYGQPFFTDYGLETIPFAYMDSYPPSGSRGAAPGTGTTTVTLYGPDASYTLVQGAFLETSYFTYGVTDPKTPTHVDVAIEPLLAGELEIGTRVDRASVATSSGFINTASSTGTGGPALLATGARTTGRAVTVRLTFTRGSTGVQAGPVVTSLALYANIAPVRIEAIDVPILAFPELDARDGHPVRVDPETMFNTLKTLEQSGEIVDYIEGGTTYKVRVDAVEFHAARFNDEEAWWEGVIVAHLITVESVGTTVTSFTTTAPIAADTGITRAPAPQAGSPSPGPRYTSPPQVFQIADPVQRTTN